MKSLWRSSCIQRSASSIGSWKRQRRTVGTRSGFHVNVGLHSLTKMGRRPFLAPHLPPQSFSTASSPPKQVKDLKAMVKPFLLRCHPDVVINPSAKKINLQAIQHLNQYLDTVRTIYKGQFTSKRQSDIIQVDFVIKRAQDQSAGRKKHKEEFVELNHRSVQLLLPELELCSNIAGGDPAKRSLYRQQLFEHARHELSKLLKVAGLIVPDGFRGTRHQSSKSGTATKIDRRTSFEQARDRFTSGIKWDLYDKMWEEGLRDLEVDESVDGIYQKQQYKNRLIATVLSNIRLKEELTAVDQLVCFRRLSLIFHDNYDDLYMEEHGGIWENTLILLTGPRPFSTSGSSLKKRQRKNLMTGFSFTLHPDNTITIQMPVDFQDDELLKQFETNLSDFYELLTDDGMDELFPEPEPYEIPEPGTYQSGIF